MVNSTDLFLGGWAVCADDAVGHRLDKPFGSVRPLPHWARRGLCFACALRLRARHARSACALGMRIPPSTSACQSACCPRSPQVDTCLEFTPLCRSRRMEPITFHFLRADVLRDGQCVDYTIAACLAEARARTWRSHDAAA